MRVLRAAVFMSQRDFHRMALDLVWIATGPVSALCA